MRKDACRRTGRGGVGIELVPRWAEAARERLALAVKTVWPQKVASASGPGQRIYLWRPEAGDRVPALFFPGKGPPAVLVHPDGAEAGRDSPEGAKLLAARRPVLFLDAFQTGAAVAPRDRSHRHFLTFNLSDDACRAQDILTTLAWIARTHPEPPELVGIGKAAVSSLFAAVSQFRET